MPKNAITEAAFHQAMLTGDADKLAAVTDATFVWTHGATQVTRAQLLLGTWLGVDRLPRPWLLRALGLVLTIAGFKLIFT